MCLGWITDNLLADRDAAPAHYEPALEAARATGDPVLLFEAQRHLGDHAHDDGDLAGARERWEESTAAGARTRHIGGTLSQQLLLAVLHRDEGDEAGAGRSPARCCGGCAIGAVGATPGQGLPGRRRPDPSPGRRAAGSLIAGIRRRWFRSDDRLARLDPCSYVQNTSTVPSVSASGSRGSRGGCRRRQPPDRLRGRARRRHERQCRGRRPRPGAVAGQGAGVGRTPGGAGSRRDRHRSRRVVRAACRGGRTARPRGLVCLVGLHRRRARTGPGTGRRTGCGARSSSTGPSCVRASTRPRTASTRHPSTGSASGATSSRPATRSTPPIPRSRPTT